MFFLLQFFRGFLFVYITGEGKERFLNLCKNKNIIIWNLRSGTDHYEFYVSKKAGKLLCDIGEKTNTQVETKGKYGLPFFLYRNRGRKIFIFGILLCMFLLYYLSFFIWDIQITGAEFYTKDQMISYLHEQGITTGILKKSIHCPSLEEKLREDFKDAAWISCDIEGTLLTVQIKESIFVQNESLAERYINDAVPNDITARKDGIITSIITRSGTPMVKQGDVVKQGDTLISGLIYYYNDYNELIETGITDADGDVFAKVVYEYESQFPMEYYEKNYSGKEHTSYKAAIGNTVISIPGWNHSFDYFDCITEIKKFKIGSSFYLPFSFMICKESEYTKEKIKLTKEEAYQKADFMINDYRNRLITADRKKEEENFTIEIKDGNCQIRGTVTVLESIVKIRNIP